MEKYEDIREVGKAIQQLQELNSFKECAKKCPWAISGYEITELQEDVTAMLKNYMRFLAEFHSGGLFFRVDGATVQANQTSNKNGKNAPAYKSNIDSELIYKLFSSGVSLNKIAKQAHCSPDTVKRRLYEMQHRMKNE